MRSPYDVKEAPLDGLQVLDLSRVLAGPWCTQILADLGAEVTKIERPGLGDETRAWGPPFDDSGQSAYFLSANRNKQSLFIDLNSKEGQQKIKELVRSCDVVVENFTCGTMERWGLDYDTLKKLQPRLIYCSISAFHPDSQWAQSPGYDALIQAQSGLMSVTGSSTKDPVRVGVATCDILTGHYLSTGILSAVIERMNSGEGQKIEISLMDVQMASLANVAMNYLVSGETPKPYGSGHPNIVPYQLFRTQTEPLFLAVGNDKQFTSFSQAMGKQWSDQPQFSTNSERVRHRLELVEKIQSEFLKAGRDQWLSLLRKYEIPCGPLQTVSESIESDYMKDSGMLTQFEGSQTRVLRNPLRFSRTPIKNYKRPPKNDSTV